jgi:ectoine hydroxylase-related dioxygenase (phytanoyl-CoA dioxygenase family)
MPLTDAQKESYERDGFLCIENYFSKTEIEILLREIQREFAVESPRRIKERSGAVRSIYASHITSEVFQRFSRLSRLVEPAMQLLGDEVYIHQFKINAKVALEGDQWEWHQDFLFWHKEDEMPQPRVLTAAVFLQDVNEYNGPMLVIPGSHKEGLIDVQAQNTSRGSGDGLDDPDRVASWMPTLTADLKYKINRETLAKLLSKNQIYSSKGLAGLTMFFHGNLFHASANNMSAKDRMSVFISYNSVENKLRDIDHPRPAFIASRDFTPQTPVPDDALLRMEIGRNGQGS